MPKVYELDASERVTADGESMYNVTIDGDVVETAVYSVAVGKVLAVIEDDDRYHELCCGRKYCDMSGAEIKLEAAGWVGVFSK